MMATHPEIIFQSAAQAFSTPLTDDLRRASLAIMPRKWVPFGYVTPEKREENKIGFTGSLRRTFKQNAIKLCIQHWGNDIDETDLDTRLTQYNIHHRHCRMFPAGDNIDLNDPDNLVLIDWRLHIDLHKCIDRIVSQAFTNRKVPMSLELWDKHLKPIEELKNLAALRFDHLDHMHISIPYPDGPYCVPQLMLYQHQLDLPLRGANQPPNSLGSPISPVPQAA